ncbi:Sphingosine kinase 1 [Toxocara canis]|uniref:Sphingosine kinase 1 n=1 Tax=Toxocara canis TaxID=6265 RepID=A0A0B2VD64_TOXCA|nr:Sphingosine kinase 1 [Toxocara canis]
MGSLSSKGVTFCECLPEESCGNNDRQQIADVYVNGDCYRSVACLPAEHELRFWITPTKYFMILYDDIISISIATKDVNGYTRDVGTELCLVVYPVVNKRRTSLNVKISFENVNIAEQWRQLISNATVAPLAPHFPKSTMPRKRRKILVIVNPFSGQKKALKMWEEETEPIFSAAQLDYDIILTERVRHATDIAKNLILDQYDCVAVVSGDGLVLEVIEGFLMRSDRIRALKMPIAHIPGGTKRVRHATDIAKNLILDQYDCVAVVSGDGLVLEVIEGFLMRSDRIRALKMPIAHIPGGTSNGLAAAICFQCNEPFAPRGIFCLEAALMVARPRYLPLRICHVQTERDGDKAMFMSATWGLVADIDIGSERFRWAGMVRLHIEAIIRIAQLPTMAYYRARVSYLPVDDKRLKRATRLRHIVNRKRFGKNHFKYDEVENIDVEFTLGRPADDISEALCDADLLDSYRMPSLKEPVPNDWVTIEGEFVYACAVNISHLGSDLPYLPSCRLDDPILYLTILDWNAVKSRLQVGLMMITIDGSRHLAYPCLQIIPVRGCRIEPLDGCGGHIAVDGEPITSGTAFQVVPSKYCATVVGRNERK